MSQVLLVEAPLLSYVFSVTTLSLRFIYSDNHYVNQPTRRKCIQFSRNCTVAYLMILGNRVSLLTDNDCKNNTM